MEPINQISPERIMRAHQFLYYVKVTPVLSDYGYDMLCRDNGLHSGCGSDLASSYTQEEIDLAERLVDGDY